MNDWEPIEGMEAFRYSAFRTVVMADRYIYDTMAALVCHGVFDRFPNLRIASIETSLTNLKEGLGVEHILFGSDWPHAEGLANPLSFVDDLTRHGYGADELSLVMRENALQLTTRRSAVPA